ncbi:hypothetical protein FHG87_017702 [Trinorchestia longiramus]|nr:hypothetical protein FHG87_017702 [Trinorchestia longiramus]
MIYYILLFGLSKNNTSLERYSNQLIASVEFEMMEQTYAELSEILFTEAEVRCAVVMALIHNNGEVDNRIIANTIGVDMRTIQRTRKKLEENKDRCGVITRASKSLDDRRKSRDADFVKRVEIMIDNDLSKFMRSMTAKLGVTVLLPWMKQGTRDRPWVYHQDSAPCHVSNHFLAWLEEHCYDLVTKHQWPPSSPDLNAMDYFFWRILENRTNRLLHTTKASLIASIKEHCTSMDREIVKTACRSFRTRIERVIEAEGRIDGYTMFLAINPSFCFYLK